MSEKTKRSSLKKKLYLFISLTVFSVAVGTALIAYFISAKQIDDYFKRLAMNSAENFADYVDADYLSDLRKEAESDEFQKLREKAEEEKDDQLLIDYLQEKGLWDEYETTRRQIDTYLSNMEDIEYLYIIALGDKGAERDMYLVDGFDVPVSETGYYEKREEGLADIDPSKKIQPTISNGDWGWLCSAYEPVYDSDGCIVCHVGCDVNMERIMSERYRFLTYIIASALIFTSLVFTGAIFFTRKVLIRPLVTLTAETKKFDPSDTSDYKSAGVVELDLKSNDEIKDIYEVIRSMQINIVDYLSDLSEMQKEKGEYVTRLKKAERDISTKDEKIGQISREVYRDALTGVGNKAAYVKKIAEISGLLADAAGPSPASEFAIVMADLNDLKKINDEYGHKAGDVYIKSCCHIICEKYKHSPVYRIGGDEFVIILQSDDYMNRNILFHQTKETFNECYNNELLPPEHRCSAAMGMAECSSEDSTVELVFKRADKKMYDDKLNFKKKNGSYR